MINITDQIYKTDFCSTLISLDILLIKFKSIISFKFEIFIKKFFLIKFYHSFVDGITVRFPEFINNSGDKM